MTTPVLEKENEFKAEKNPLLPLSQVWILSTTLPALYTQPILHSKPTPNCFTTQNFLSKFVSFKLIFYYFVDYYFLNLDTKPKTNITNSIVNFIKYRN